MRRFIRVAVGAGVVLGLAASVTTAAGASSLRPGSSTGAGASRAVFVQTDDPAGNHVVAYTRGHDGTLTVSATYTTGGTGGMLAGSVVDHLASQGSVAYDRDDALLYVVNAGSNDVSVFSVRGAKLAFRETISSGGTFPVSVAVRDHVVYVLNALNGGSVQGYAAFSGHLYPLPGSHRALGLDPTATPQFTNTPGQVAFSPDGAQLIVTTKANGSAIDVFHVGFFGSLSRHPVVNSEPGTVPFAVTFDRAGHLVVAEAGTNALATYTLDPDGTIGLVARVATGQSATCWVARAQGFDFASNAASATVSGYHIAANGHLNLLGQTSTDPGTVDAASSANQRFLYVETGGNGIIDEYRVSHTGSLSEIGSLAVPDAVGAEGIAAF
jgi:6-phosphogluconolactonase (cycloisomerase 2 family)